MKKKNKALTVGLGVTAAVVVIERHHVAEFIGSVALVAVNADNEALCFLLGREIPCLHIETVNALYS